MEVSVLNIKGQETGRKVTLNEAIFGVEPNDHVIYLDVKQYLANQRQGTAKSKERSELSGSTRKLGRQKGGGGARHGDINSPLLRGGARVFGPTPRDYSVKLNKKVKALARSGSGGRSPCDDRGVAGRDFRDFRVGFRGSGGVRVFRPRLIGEEIQFLFVLVFGRFRISHVAVPQSLDVSRPSVIRIVRFCPPGSGALMT